MKKKKQKIIEKIVTNTGHTAIITRPTSSEIERYRVKDIDPITKKPWVPFAVMHYRGKDFPIYNDDYGQAYFTYFPDGRCISTFSFSMMPYEEIAYYYDDSLHTEKVEKNLLLREDNDKYALKPGVKLEDALFKLGKFEDYQTFHGPIDDPLELLDIVFSQYQRGVYFVDYLDDYKIKWTNQYYVRNNHIVMECPEFTDKDASLKKNQKAITAFNKITIQPKDKDLRRIFFLCDRGLKFARTKEELLDKE